MRCPQPPARAVRPSGARPTAIEPVPAITPTPQPSGVPAATTRSPSLTSTSRRASRASSAQPARIFAVVGPVEARQTEAGHLDRSRLEPRVDERGAIAASRARRAASSPTALAFDGPDVPRPRTRIPARQARPPSTCRRRRPRAANLGHGSFVETDCLTDQADLAAVRSSSDLGARRARRPPGRRPAPASDRPPHRPRISTALCVVDPRQLAEDAPAADPQLLVRRPEVDHPVAQRLADPHHRAGGDHVQDHLGRRPGLQPGRAGDDLGADERGDLEVDLAAQQAGAVAGDADGGRPATPAPPGRPPARRASARRWRSRRPGRCGPTPSAAMSAAPRSGSSSAPSTARVSAVGPPAIRPTTISGGVLKVGGHSAASRTPSRPDVPAPT